jgi:anti-sigma-K factor RskA
VAAHRPQRARRRSRHHEAAPFSTDNELVAAPVVVAGVERGRAGGLRSDKLRLVPTAAATAAPAGRSLQFWTKAESATAPTSLGLVQAGQTLELPLSRLPAAEARQLFEITLEPEGGSTVGRPTGPILFVGRTVAL